MHGLREPIIDAIRHLIVDADTSQEATTIAGRCTETELRRLCDLMHVDTGGRKSALVARVVDNARA